MIVAKCKFIAHAHITAEAMTRLYRPCTVQVLVLHFCIVVMDHDHNQAVLGAI